VKILTTLNGFSWKDVIRTENLNLAFDTFIETFTDLQNISAVKFHRNHIK
jgi:hypothetical protein